jgi:hypothetical protein
MGERQIIISSNRKSTPFLNDLKKTYSCVLHKFSEIPNTGVDFFIAQIHFGKLRKIFASCRTNSEKKKSLYNDLKSSVVCPNKLFIWDRSNEGVVKSEDFDWFEMIKETLIEYFNIPQTKIIFLSMNGEDHLHSNIKYYNYSWGKYLEQKISKLNYTKKRQKKFLFLGGTPRWNKMVLLLFLYESNLLSKALWSCSDMLSKKQSLESQSKKKELARNQYARLINSGVIDLLPKVLDVDPTDKSKTESSIVSEFYEKTYFSVIAETDFTHGEVIRYTEKVYKNFFVKHPFVLVGSAHTLKLLQTDGFKTFHPFIDESYDDISDPNKRMEAVVKEIERLCDLGKNEWSALLANIEPILIHNKKIAEESPMIKTNIDKILKLGEPQ